MRTEGIGRIDKRGIKQFLLIFALDSSMFIGITGKEQKGKKKNTKNEFAVYVDHNLVILTNRKHANDPVFAHYNKNRKRSRQ